MDMTDIKTYVSLVKKNLKSKFSEIQKQLKNPIVLNIVQVGNNQASNSYIRGKKKDASELGISVNHIKYEENVAPERFFKELDILQTSIIHNGKPEGIIVQLPLPEELKGFRLDRLVDVDGFSSDSLVNPCTPQGIMDYLEYNKVMLDGMNAVVLGRSDIVGKPMARLLLEANANVTVLHSHTFYNDKHNFLKQADVIVCATGQRNTLTNTSLDEYKSDAIVIDVGINRNDDGTLCGDCAPNLPVKYQSPVPGGVGLLTRVALFENLYRLISKRFLGENE